MDDVQPVKSTTGDDTQSVQGNAQPGTSGAPSVIIYSTPVCVYCKMAKKFFADNNIKYTEHNVQDDEKAREEMVAKSHQLGVPVIDVGGEIFVGFDKKGLSQALKIG